MIFERAMLYSLYNPYSIYIRMAMYCKFQQVCIVLAGVVLGCLEYAESPPAARAGIHTPHAQM